MDCNYLEKISLLVDDKLSPSETKEVKKHLAVCAKCQAAEASFLAVRRQINAIRIPRDRAAESRVLNGILRNGKSKPAGTRGKFVYLRPALAAAAVLIVVAAAGILIDNRAPQKSWDVARLEGTPKIAERGFTERGRLRVGEWLETNDSSSAKITVADIGEVEVEPESRIRLVETNRTEHRLELARGSIIARINAPPRLFFVNTPSATVIDYGCAYSLSVDEDGATVLHVTEGWVSLALNGRESLVPASAYAKSRRGTGPGTPYFEDASGEFTVALDSFDFENGGSTAIDVLLAESRPRDALSLWYLLERTNESDRARVFQRLAQLVSPPENATRAGVLALDRKMLDEWKETIDVTSVGESLTGVKPNAKNLGTLAPAGNMMTPRTGHTAARLPDGRVLIAGGTRKDDGITASAEVFDPATGRFSPAGQMTTARTGHAATPLSDGKILITGGADAGANPLSSAELYDPASGVFAATGNLLFARSNHQATPLSDGKVLITGGGSNDSAISGAEIYDTERGVFSAAGQMTAPRKFHQATLLASGDVLITGGSSGVFSPDATLSSAEIFDRQTKTFAASGNMTLRRYAHAATGLADGRVLITGGSTGREWKDRTASAEIFDPKRKLFTKTESMSLPRFHHQAATLLLADGRVLIAGAGARAEIFDPASGGFGSTAGNVGTGRVFATATLLSNGSVLIAGGYNFAYPPTASAWLYSIENR